MLFFNENNCVLIYMSLKIVPKGPVDNKLALVQQTVRRQAITWTTDD